VTSATLDLAAERLADLLVRPSGALLDPGRADLVFEAEPVARPLAPGAWPADVWAVDGGQAVVRDARCLQLVVVRAARVRFREGRCVLEEPGDLEARVIGGAESRRTVEGLGLGVAADAGTEGLVNLLRDVAEWRAVQRCVEEADPGALVLVDGDLVPDWRVPSAFVADLLARAAEGGVTLAGVTKHSSLSRGGTPLLGQLEREAEAALGPRARWWAPVARTRPDLTAAAPGLQVVAARLDPAAPFAYRVDLPAPATPEVVLGALAAMADDAAFPGYPYPLNVADRLAACPRWVREEVGLAVDELLERAGVPYDVRTRAFADRHDLMERA
jgi:hypothetical protein